MIASWLTGARTIDVDCTVDIEKTPESFHAYAVPEGITIRPGDEVTVHGAPTTVAFGDRLVVRCRATVTRAGLIDRAWAHVTGLFELTELYEVGFSAREAP
jgi:hypothetical protein